LLQLLKHCGVRLFGLGILTTVTPERHNGEQKPLSGLSFNFLVVGVYDVSTTFKFGDDQFRVFWLTEGQSLPFS